MAFVQDWATYRDLEPGAREVTGNELDVALSPGGFLTVETPQGVRYTRDGSLQINDQGQLVTQRGHPVISLGGTPILFTPADSDITITGTGEGTTNNGARGTLQLVSFPNEQALEKLGSNLYAADEEPNPDPTSASRRACWRHPTCSRCGKCPVWLKSNGPMKCNRTCFANPIRCVRRPFASLAA